MNKTYLWFSKNDGVLVTPIRFSGNPSPLGRNDPAAIGAGSGLLFPLHVSAFRRDGTSWRVSEYWTIVLDSIHTNAFPVPQLTLAFNRPNDHTVKLHSPPFRTVSACPRAFLRGSSMSPVKGQA